MAACFQRLYLKHLLWGSRGPAPAPPRPLQSCCKQAGPLHQLLLLKHWPWGPGCFSARSEYFYLLPGPLAESLCLLLPQGPVSCSQVGPLWCGSQGRACLDCRVPSGTQAWLAGPGATSVPVCGVGV